METNKQLTIRVLGTGTSQGVPVIGCDCEVCTSTDSRDKRMRVSIMVTYGDTQIAVDCGPDFRHQMLAAHAKHLDAILLTHEHNDHVAGLDDVRPFNFRSQKDMPVYGLPRTLARLEKSFDYVFAADPYPGAPRVTLHELSDQSNFQIGKLPIQAIGYLHGKMPVLGYRFFDFAYITDIKTITEAELAKLQNLDTLILSCLHHNAHHSHLNLEEALALIQRINPRQTYLTHLSHRMGKHATIESTLPEGVKIAFDGMEVFNENNNGNKN